MGRPPLPNYFLSLPERIVRSALALAGGALREVGEVTIPSRVRRTRLYRNIVEATLRFVIEDVGQVEGAYPEDGKLPENFLVRKAAGNVIDVAGFLAFRASPVWVIAALADLSGAGRDLIQEIAQALEKEGLLEPGRKFDSVEHMLDGLERTAGQLAESVNTPPLDVKTLRQDWTKLREEARHIAPEKLPTRDVLETEWSALKQEASVQQRSVFELSTALAMSAIRAVPEGVAWLSRATQVSAQRTGQVLAGGLLEHYRDQLAKMREEGYARYWAREFQPYVAGALRQFSRDRTSLTERLLKRRATR